ncbi:MAG: hypothetical protein VB144_14410 [Clostridia bacterium]|nr:hypothetical protein [Clostridia bacterium]
MADWYVMLFPSGIPESFRVTVEALEQRMGGVPVDSPHVTVAYLEGEARPDDLVERMASMPNPSVHIQGRGLFSFWPDSPHALFGFCLFMRIRKNAALRSLYVSIASAFEGSGVLPARSWQDSILHLRLLDHLPVSPSEALSGLDDEAYTISFPAAWLVLSQVDEDGRFQEWFRLPLQAD